jgi:LuxR family maltose regulon positive regulatory protein
MLRTKLHRPPITPDQVIRTQLIQKLEAHRHLPLTLVTAPAGYGKSIAISQWLEQTPVKSAWVSLDAEHNDLVVFLEYVLAAIEQIFPDQLTETSALLKAGTQPPLKVLAHSFINSLDHLEEEFILALDDYHLIGNDQIHSLINELLAYPPENLHLVILTRWDPSLNIRSLLAHGRVHICRMQELAIPYHLLTDLIRRVVHFEVTDEALVGKLFRKTEGWVTGIRLALLNVQSEKDLREVLTDLEGDHYSISDFLVEEVINRQSEEVQKLLLISSLFNRFCERLIDHLMGFLADGLHRIRGKDFIEKIRTANLFLIPLDLNYRWFRYHHLFQELLQHKLQNLKEVDFINKVRIEAAKWMEKEGNLDDAFQQYVSAGELTRAARLVELYRHQLSDKEQWNILGKWLRSLPTELIQASPELMLQQAWIFLGNFQLELLPPVLDQVEEQIPSHPENDLIKLELQFLKATLHYWMGESSSALELLEPLADKIPEDILHFRSNWALHLALARHMAGDRELAFQSIDEQLKSTRPEQVFFQSYLVGGKMFIHSLSGNFHQASKVSQQLIQLTKGTSYRNIRAWSEYMPGVHHFQLFELEKAVCFFDRTIQYTYLLDHRAVLDAMAGKALALVWDAKEEQAERALRNLRELMNELAGPVKPKFLHSTQARMELFTGEAEKALAWAGTSLPPPVPASFFIWLEVPWLTQARVWTMVGAKKEVTSAIVQLETLHTMMQGAHFTAQEIEILCLKALGFWKLEKDDQAMECLLQALKLGAKEGLMRPFVEPGEPMLVLLDEVKDPDIPIPYLDKISHLIWQYSSQSLQKTEEPTRAFETSERSKGFQVSLSLRETEIVHWLTQGLRNREIAQKLFISEATVKKHLYNLFQKMEVSNRVQLANRVNELQILGN